ncbi:hypothetical protein J6590_009382 [Homalodisca vitripennis]|nr:hypothetical protein J6590_009382 [Homalodisca vitripennis]
MRGTAGSGKLSSRRFSSRKTNHAISATNRSGDWRRILERYQMFQHEAMLCTQLEGARGRYMAKSLTVEQSHYLYHIDYEVPFKTGTRS